MSDSATPRTVARQAPLFIGFRRQEYGSGLPFPSPRDLLDPRIEPTSPVLAGSFFTAEPPGKSHEQSVLLKVYFEITFILHLEDGLSFLWKTVSL